MEAVVEQNRIEVKGRAGAAPFSEKNWDEARERLDAYLRAWKLPEAAREEIAARVIAMAEERASDSDLVRAVIEEAEKVIGERGEEISKLPRLVPQRTPETQPMTMQTSLNHLPSFRMIAGWFVLIALIVLAFILTR